MNHYRYMIIDKKPSLMDMLAQLFSSTNDISLKMCELVKPSLLKKGSQRCGNLLSPIGLSCDWSSIGIL